jgi:membrane-bound metal-dependent hydrolase YbcI (DUF457 family)
MTGRTHVVTGILAGFIYIKTQNAPPIEVLSGAINACKLPDIDQKIHIFKHREFTHSFIIPCFLYYLFQYYENAHFRYIISGFLVGWVAHMFMDMFNGSGIALLYPITKHRFHLLDIKYDDKFEKILYYLLIVACFVVLIGVEKVLNALLTFNWHPLLNELEKLINNIIK